MTEARSVLFELGTEELPPRSLETLKESLAVAVVAELESVGLPFDQTVTAYASSRRLALRIPGVAERTAGATEIRKGPSVEAAFDSEGEPTRALLGFAKGCQADSEQMQRWKTGEDRLKTDKGEWLKFDEVVEPRDCRELLPEISTEPWRDCRWRNACAGERKRQVFFALSDGWHCCTVASRLPEKS